MVLKPYLWQPNDFEKIGERRSGKGIVNMVFSKDCEFEFEFDNGVKEEIYRLRGIMEDERTTYKNASEQERAKIRAKKKERIYQ